MNYTGTKQMGRFELIDTLPKLKKLAEQWDVKSFSFDTEFTSLSWIDQRLIGMSLYSRESKFDPVFIQFNFWDNFITKEKDPKGGRKKIDVVHTYEKTDAIEFEEAKPYLLKIFEGAKVTCASAKVEWKIFSKYGITNWEIEDDVNLMSWMLNVDTPNDLKWNATKELGVSMRSYEETIGQKAGNIDWNKVDWYEYAEYGARDAWATELLKYVFSPRIAEFPALENCYRKLEIPLLKEVARSEMAGVSIDCEILNNMSKEADKEIKRLEQDIYDKVGVEFNVGSSKQLAEILFDRLGYPVIKKSEKTGARSCDEDTLKELAFRGYEVADDILDYRKFVKLKTTYMDAIPEKVDIDGRLRGSFNQASTTTSRFSSSNPNLQNIPNDKRFPIKEAFVPKKGYKFLCFDWSTIEIRIMAHESNDETLIRVLNDGHDVHAETRDSINSQFGTSLDRNMAKTINFAVLYLMSAKSLAYTLNKDIKKRFKKGEITQEEYDEMIVSDNTAQKIINGFFNLYQGFAQYIQDITESTKELGWVWTLGGHRRPVTELGSRKTFGIGQRKCVNTPIQGGAADLMKFGILKLQRMYEDKGFDATTLLYVHDEYVIEVKEEQAEECAKEVQLLMENIYPQCLVPIKCEGGVFDNWNGLKAGTKNKKSALESVRIINDIRIKKILNIIK